MASKIEKFIELVAVSGFVFLMFVLVAAGAALCAGFAVEVWLGIAFKIAVLNS